MGDDHPGWIQDPDGGWHREAATAEPNKTVGAIAWLGLLGGVALVLIGGNAKVPGLAIVGGLIALAGLVMLVASGRVVPKR